MACIPINSDFAAAFVATEITHPHFECNCRLQAYKCGCGNFHLQVVATAAIGRDEILIANTEWRMPRSRTHLYADHAKECRLRQQAPLPLDIIQGDVKPFIQHLQFAGRFRCSDLIALLTALKAD